MSRITCLALLCLAITGGGTCGPSGLPTPLAAGAGDDASVDIDDVQMLTGSATGGKAPYTYLWEPVSGPAQTLTDATSATASVTAIALGTNVFKLTVTDDDGTTATDEVSITVTPPTGVRRVLASATGAGTGLNWTDAFADLQEALAAVAASNGTITELWVGKGTYKPGPAGSDRSTAFVLLNGLSVYGGFAGTEVRRTERNVTNNSANHLTTLSGDFDSDDSVGVFPNFMNYDENAFSIVSARDLSSAVLDGFTLRGGGASALVISGGTRVANCRFIQNLSNGVSARGAAVQVLVDTTTTNVTFETCEFIENSALYGGALYGNGGSATLKNCKFTTNTADRGGAISFISESLTLEDCTFTTNVSGSQGGALEHSGNILRAERCTFTGNRADTPASSSGGAIFSTGTNTYLINCLFTQNEAKTLGGVLDSRGTNLFLTNCAFSRNTANNQGGVYTQADATTVTGCTFSGNVNRSANSGAGFNSADPATLINCVFWGNVSTPVGADVIRMQLSTNSGGVQNTISYSNVQGNAGGALAGSNNIGADPLFLNAANDDLKLSSNSPCINVGNNGATTVATDLSGGSRIKGAPPVVDMGAYEF